VIPENWDVVQLDSVAKRGSGHTPDKAHPEYWNGDIKWVSLADSQRLDDLYISETSAKITPEGIANSSANLLPAGSCIVTRDAGVGRSAILAEPMAVSQHFMAWQCGPRLNNHFLYFVLHGMKSELERIAIGNTIKTIGLPYFRDLRIQLPSIAEQNCIASALTEIDQLIRELELSIAKKQGIKQAAMQELLTGKRRLPGFEGEWEVKRLGDFADCTSGGTPATAITAYWGGNIRWMSSGELHLKRVAEVAGRITTSGLENSSAKLLPPKCVLVGLAGQGKTRGTTAISLVELSTNQSIAAILPNPSFVPEYLYYCFDARYDELRELSSGSGGRGGLNLSLIKSLRLPMPTPDEQAAISAALSDMDCELKYLDDKLSRLRDIKQGMMQQLLTGKIRLK
jgi:type I restriction enzyme S subunit